MIYIYMCGECACVSFVRVKEKSCFKGLYLPGRQLVAQTSSAPPSRCQSQTRATMLSLQCRERPQYVALVDSLLQYINGPRYGREYIIYFFHEKTCLAPHIILECTIIYYNHVNTLIICTCYLRLYIIIPVRRTREPSPVYIAVCGVSRFRVYREVYHGIEAAAPAAKSDEHNIIYRYIIISRIRIVSGVYYFVLSCVVSSRAVFWGGFHTRPYLLCSSAECV